MSNDSLAAAQILQQEHELNPDVVELATLVSLSVRIEPELLRAVRLATARHLHAGVEADLWFSSLVASSGPDGIAFHPEVTQLLRARLRDEIRRETVDRVWAVTTRLHKDVSPALAVEERIAWHVLTEGDASAAAIEEELSGALVALVDHGRPGVARWVAQAWPRLPAEARRTASAWQLKEASRPYLGGHQIESDDQVDERLGELDLRAIVANLPDAPLAVRRVGSELQLGQVDLDRAVAIRLPDTDPRIFELTWSQVDGDRSRRVQLRSGASARYLIGYGPVQLRTAAGARYELARQQPPSVVLFSFGDEGQSFAETLADRLRVWEVDVRLRTPHSADLGGDRAPAQDADALLVVLTSDDSFTETAVPLTFREAAYAFGDLPLILVLVGVGGSDLPSEFQSLAHIELDSSGSEAELLRLLDALERTDKDDPRELSEVPEQTELTTIAPLSYFEVTFDRAGEVVGVVDQLLAAPAELQLTDLVVFTHGFNATRPETRRQFRTFFRLFGSVLSEAHDSGPEGRRIGTVGVFWPSQAFSGRDADANIDSAAVSTGLLEMEEEPADSRGWLGRLWRGACRATRTTTFWTMENRADVVGRRGLGPLLDKLSMQNPGLRLHLVGHSMGAGLMTSALHRPTDGAPVGARVRSLVLLQSMIPQFAFARSLPKAPDQPGPLADLAARVDGPIVVTYSKNDDIEKNIFPLLARITGMADARADSGEYSAIGFNGAQRVGAVDLLLLPVGGPYPAFTAHGFTNVDCSRLILDHADIVKPEIGWLLVAAMAGSGSREMR